MATGLPKTIMVVCEMYSAYHHPLLEALREAVEPRGYGVLCITGQALEEGVSNDGCTSIYKVASTMDVAGTIILAATLGHSVDLNVVERFVGRFSHLPMVTLGQVTPYCSSVLADNVSPMRQLVEHMTSDESRRRFVFLRGYSGCVNSHEREQAFREVLDQRGHQR